MAPSVVQTKAGSIAGTSLTLTLTSSTTAGNCLFALVNTTGTTNAAVSAITLGGSAGNWGVIATEGNSSDHAIQTIWGDPNCSGGQTSVVITLSGGSGTQSLNAVVYEVSGMPGTLTGMLDKSSTLSSSGFVTSWSLGPTATTTQASEIAFGMAGGNVSSTTHGTYTGPGTLWTNTSYPGVNNGGGSGFSAGGVVGFQVLSSTGTVSYNGTCTSSTLDCLLVTLKAATSTTGTGSLALGGIRLSGAAPANVTGTGSVGLGGLHFAGTGSEKYTGTGSLALGGIRLSGSGPINITGTGGVGLGGIHLAGTGTEKYTGTGSLALGGIGLSGTNAVPATIALVQSKSGTGTASPVTVTLTGSTTAGNCLVVAVGLGNSTTNPTVSGVTLGGSAGNFANAVALSNNADANVTVWTDQNCAGGQTAVAVSFTGGSGAGNGCNVFVWEFSGVAATSAVDKTASAGAGSGNPSSGATATLSQATEVAVGVAAGIGAAGAPTIAGPSSPWTNQTATSAARTAAVGGYQIVNATTALTYAGTNSTGRVGAAIVTLISGSANVTGTGSIGLGGLAFHVTGSEKFTGTGSVALGGLHLSGSGTRGLVGSGGLALGGLRFSATNGIQGTGSFRLGSLALSASGTRGFAGSGSLALGGLAFHGTGTEKFTGTASFRLGSLAFSGSQNTVAVAPVIPTELAGAVATAADLNKWANAATWLAGSAALTKPVFYLVASATQTLTTSFTAVNYSSSGAIFKDNNGGWVVAHPSRYTVATAGFYTIAWSVSAASGAAHLQCYAQVTTTSANPFNPSTTMKFQASNHAATTNIVVTSSGGLVPIYLTNGDYIEVYALVGTSQPTSLTFAPQLCGEWVSS